MWTWLTNFLNNLFGKKEPPEDEPEPIVIPEENPDPGRPALRKALITGINDYPTAPLRGCVNDALLMYKVLTEKYDFKNDNVDLLTDGECTKKNILKHLKKLTRGVKPGDYLFFHYSGHGSQVVVDDWTNSNEPDGRDEILCPVDLDWNDPLRDHELGALFKTLPPKVKILIILDCCNSGTGLRNIWKTASLGSKTADDWLNRFIPPPPSNILSNPKISLDDDLNFVLPKEYRGSDIQTRKNGFMVHTAQQGNAVLISGCQDNQTSADAYIGGKYRGALTYTLVQTLKESDYKITYRNLIEQVNKKLDAARFTQNPQLEAKKSLFDREFLK